MRDERGREINYLRVSVTDRCNLRCRYCMPEQGIDIKPHEEVLRLEEFARIIAVASEVGIRKVRLTGGEPLVRRNLPELVRMVAAIDRIDDIAITTNGVLFPAMALQLKVAGLHRVNLSLDTLDPKRYRFITRFGHLEAVTRALDLALELEFHPVKVNVVIIRGFNDDEILDFCRLAAERPLHVRFIEFMPVGHLEFWQHDRIMRCEEIRRVIEKRFQLAPGKMSRGNGPAKYYALQGAPGSIGFISPMSNHFCAECNRLRLTADGKLRACLYDCREIDLRGPMREGCDDRYLAELVRQGVRMKPERHLMTENRWPHRDRKMYQIGG